LLKSRNVVDAFTFFDCKTDIKLGDVCPNGHQLRPHIVWFGEDVPMIEEAAKICETADVLIIIGTSMQVYPAAGLRHYVPQHTPTYFIDPRPAMESRDHVTVIAESATMGIKKVMQLLVTP
jgi:NAD-dependent deacetylase